MKRALFVTLLTAFGIAGCKQSTPSPAPEAKPSVTMPGSAGSGSAGSAGSAAVAENDPWTKEAPQKDPLKRPFFWSIEKDGKTSYALGTIHVGVDPESRLPDVVWAKLDAAPTFTMETDLTDGALQKVLECVKCSLRKDLGEKHWKKLEEVLGADVAARIDGMKPMVAATMMSLRGLPSTTQMDTLLLARAQNKNKKVVYLEKAEHQARVLEKTMNLKALKMMLADVEAGVKQTKDMLEAYVEGDDAKMVALSDSEKAKALKHGYTAAEYDQSMEEILYSRNAAWIEPIEKMHAEGGAFIAVGALHLMGPKNVLELLAAKGYKVTRIAP